VLISVLPPRSAINSQRPWGHRRSGSIENILRPGAQFARTNGVVRSALLGTFFIALLPGTLAFEGLAYLVFVVILRQEGTPLPSSARGTSG